MSNDSGCNKNKILVSGRVWVESSTASRTECKNEIQQTGRIPKWLYNKDEYR